MFGINIDVSVGLSVFRNSRISSACFCYYNFFTIIISSLPFADTSKAYLLENFIGGSIVCGHFINKMSISNDEETISLFFHNSYAVRFVLNKLTCSASFYIGWFCMKNKPKRKTIITKKG